MAMNINPPSRPQGSATEQLERLYSYLFRLSEELNMALSGVETSGKEQLYKAIGGDGKQAGKVPQSTAEAYQQLKALIVKTATEVTGNIRKVVTEITQEYMASSEFGTYSEYLNALIEASAGGLAATWDAENKLVTPVSGPFEQYTAVSKLYMKLGIVGENEDGTLEAGVVIGKDLQKVTVDGVEYITSKDVYSLLTADALSFWRDGVMMSKVSLTDFFVGKAYIEEVTAEIINTQELKAAIVEAVEAQFDTIVVEDLIDANVVKAAAVEAVAAELEKATIKDAQIESLDGSKIKAGTVTAEKVDIASLFAAQATINALIAADISNNQSLKLAVNNVQVGGTNLVSLQDDKLAYVNSTRHEWGNMGHCRSGYGFVMYGAQNSPTGYCSVEFQSDIELYPGKYMLSFWSWCAGVNVQPTVVCNLLDGNAGIDMNVAEYAPGIGTLKHYEIPVTVAQTMHAMLRFITWTQLAAGEIYISDVKLEKGSRATDWSPAPQDTESEIAGLRSEINLVPGKIELAVKSNDEFRAGTTVEITKDIFRASTPKYVVDIVDEDGETNMLSIDENGAHMQSLTAPDVTPRYAGDAVIYVNPAATSAQIASGGYYRSLADALGALSNRHLDADVMVSLAAGMTEYGTLKLSGTAGPGKITIMGRPASPAKIVGGIYMYFVNARVMMQYVNIDTTAIALQAEGCMYVNASNCVFTGPGVTVTNTMAVRASLGAMVSVTNCEMYDCYRSVYGHMGGQVSATNCKGNCRAAANNSVVYISGTASCDLDSWTAGEYAGKVFTSSVTVDHGTATVPETAPTTVEVAASGTRSYTDAWRQGDTEIRQGYYSGAGEWAGCMWFPTTSFAGKTIKSASVTMTRQNGSGKGAAVTLTLYGITIASASGNPHTGKVSYGVIGTIDNGETKTFTLPTAAAQALASGTIKGFMLYAGDGRVMSGKTYSTNYCKIVSSGSAAPKLSVTY